MDVSFALATAYQMSGQMDRAEKTFKTACQEHPLSPLPFYRLGVFYGFIRNYEQAIQMLTKASGMAPKDPSVLKALSLACNQHGDRDRAIQLAQQIVALVPDSAPDLFYLGALKQDAKLGEEAAKLYRQVLALESNHVGSLNNLAVLLSQTGQTKEAADMARKAVSLAPKQGAVLDTLGWITCLQGQPRDAIKLLEEAAALLPANPTIQYHLGMAAHQARQIEPARRYFAKALELSSTFPEYADCVKMKKQLDSVTP